VVGNRIVVTGGQANHKLVGPTEVFDGKSWKDVAPLPTPRDHLAGASDGKYFYAVGGRLLGPDKNVAAFERDDPDKNRWEQLSPLPTPRGGLGATVLGDRLVTIGGESPTGVFDNVEAYDIGRGRWSVLAPMRTPRHGMGVATVGDTIYVIGGAAAAGHTHSVATNEALTLR